MKESFWEIVVVYSEEGGKRCTFKWERGRLFDHAAAVVFYQPCVLNPTATVLAVRASSCIGPRCRGRYGMTHSIWPHLLIQAIGNEILFL